MVPFVAGMALAVGSTLGAFQQVGSRSASGCSAGCAAAWSAAEPRPERPLFPFTGRATDVGERRARLASGQGARRVRRARARSGHQTCCWARPGSCRWGTLEPRVRSGSRGPRLAGWRGPDAETDACPIGEAGTWGMVPSVGEECVRRPPWADQWKRGYVPQNRAPRLIGLRSARRLMARGIGASTFRALPLTGRLAQLCEKPVFGARSFPA